MKLDSRAIIVAQPLKSLWWSRVIKKWKGKRKNLGNKLPDLPQAKKNLTSGWPLVVSRRC